MTLFLTCSFLLPTFQARLAEDEERRGLALDVAPELARGLDVLAFEDGARGVGEDLAGGVREVEVAALGELRVFEEEQRVALAVGVRLLGEAEVAAGDEELVQGLPALLDGGGLRVEPDVDARVVVGAPQPSFMNDPL